MKQQQLVTIISLLKIPKVYLLQIFLFLKTTEREAIAEMLPAEASIEEAVSPERFGPLYPVTQVSKWQINQLPKNDLDPST